MRIRLTFIFNKDLILPWTIIFPKYQLITRHFMIQEFSVFERQTSHAPFMFRFSVCKKSILLHCWYYQHLSKTLKLKLLLLKWTNLSWLPSVIDWNMQINESEFRPSRIIDIDIKMKFRVSFHARADPAQLL